MQRSRRAADYQDIARPVAAMADEYPAGHATVLHSHRRSQLFYGSSGVARVATTDGYESSSAFGAMFRRTFGCSPRNY